MLLVDRRRSESIIRTGTPGQFSNCETATLSALNFSELFLPTALRMLSELLFRKRPSKSPFGSGLRSQINKPHRRDRQSGLGNSAAYFLARRR